MDLKIISPSSGQAILGDKATISFIISDFTVGQDGYIRLWLDNPIEEATNASKITSSFDYTLSGLPEGLHKLTLEAVKTNNLSFSPKVKQTVSFTTILPLTQTAAISPASPPPNTLLGLNSQSWQYVLTFGAILMMVIGLIIKMKWGKPKIWQ